MLLRESHNSSAVGLPPSLNDVTNFVRICNSELLTEKNRSIMVLRKGRKDGVNRDTNYYPFEKDKYPNFKFKAPMLCSLSKELGACVMCRVIGYIEI